MRIYTSWTSRWPAWILPQGTLSNYDEDASILISTHIISDIENILDEVIFIKDGSLHTHALVDELREKDHKSIDTIFREVFKC